MAEHVEEMPVDLAGRGLKVMFVARPDACRACRTMQGRVFDPRQAPSLPLRECLTPPCRCRYEGYDPQAVVSRLLSAGVDAVKEERLEQARELLYQVIDLDERNEKAWLWLSGVVPGVEERIICLENVLAINPHHQLAKEGLRHLQTQRRAKGAGPSAARKIRDAREAIDEIKGRHPKVATLKQAPPPPIPSEGRPLLPVAASAQPVGKPRKRIAEAEGTPVGFSGVLLWVLIAAVVLALIGTASLLVVSLAR
ncbi:MAG TPA: hypothetical protein VJ714_04880 [Anaerolineae bacterium]|nr:hypothetical protein [Anaerolineae bacterium]